MPASTSTPRAGADRETLRASQAVRPETYDETARTVDVVFYSGAAVDRRDYDGAYTLAIDVDGMDLSLLNNRAGLFVDHLDCAEYQIGVIERAWVAGGQAMATVRFGANEAGSRYAAAVADGILNKLSMGVRILERQITEGEDGSRAVIATQSQPYEISFVGTPADFETCVLSAADTRRRAPTPLDHGLNQMETNMTAPTPAGDQTATTETAAQAPAQAERLAAAPAAPVVTAPAPASAPAPAPTMEALSRADAERMAAGARIAERTRASDIRAACEAFALADQAEALIAEGIDINAARERLQNTMAERAEQTRIRGHSAIQFGRDEVDTRREAIASAILHRGGVSDDLPDNARIFRARRLGDVARMSLESEGFNLSGMSDEQVSAFALGAQRSDFAQLSGGAHSTSDFPLILGSVLRRSLMAGYEARPVAYTQIARRGMVTDFRPHTRIRIGDMPGPVVVSEGGTIKHGTLGEQGETIQAIERARLIAITRQALINDDLGALTTIPSTLGGRVRLLEDKIVLGILIANPVMSDGNPLFHAAHGNLIAPAADITVASVAAGYQAMMLTKGVGDEAKGDEPDYIAVAPGILLTGANRAHAARAFLSSVVVPTKDSDVNPYKGDLSPLASPYLTPAAGKEPWFLFADPAVAPVLEYAYINGQEGPIVEQRAGWNTTGLEFRVIHDFAAGAIDWRGAVKNAGA